MSQYMFSIMIFPILLKFKSYINSLVGVKLTTWIETASMSRQEKAKMLHPVFTMVDSEAWNPLIISYSKFFNAFAPTKQSRRKKKENFFECNTLSIFLYRMHDRPKEEERKVFFLNAILYLSSSFRKALRVSSLYFPLYYIRYFYEYLMHEK